MLSVVAVELCGLIILVNLRLVHYEVNDLAVFVSAARALAEGRSPYELADSAGDVRFAGRESPLLNVNPPTSLPLLRWLAGLDPVAALPMWMVAMLVAYVGSLFVLLRAYPQRATAIFVAWALALAGLWDSIHLGQIYTILLSLLVIPAWLLLRGRRYALAGIPIGILAAMKPNFLVWPVLLAFAGYSAASWVAVAVVFIAGVLPVALFGPSIYAEWMALIRSVGRGVDLPVNASLPAMISRMGWNNSLQVAGAGVLLMVLAAWVFRSRSDPLKTSGVALAGALLASPIATVGYTVLLLPVFVHSGRSRLLLGSAALLLSPAFLVWPLAGLSPIAEIAFGSVYFLGVLLLLMAQLDNQVARSGFRLVAAAVTPHPLRRLGWTRSPKQSQKRD